MNLQAVTIPFFAASTSYFASKRRRSAAETTLMMCSVAGLVYEGGVMLGLLHT